MTPDIYRGAWKVSLDKKEFPGNLYFEFHLDITFNTAFGDDPSTISDKGFYLFQQTLRNLSDEDSEHGLYLVASIHAMTVTWLMP